MRRTRRPLFAVLLLAASAACRREAPVATLLEAAGTVARSQGGRFDRVERGTRFKANDALETGPRSSARLLLADGSTIRIGENARLRLDRGTTEGGHAPTLIFELGDAEIENVATPFALQTPGGRANLTPGTRARVRADGASLTFEVFVGQALVIEPNGEHPLGAGAGLRIHIGGAVVEQMRVVVGDAIVEQNLTIGDGGVNRDGAIAGSGSDGNGPPPVPAQRKGAVAAVATDRAAADVSVTAGERAIMHDSGRRLAVRLRFDDLCPAEGLVEIYQGRHRHLLAGAGAVVLRLAGPEVKYQLRCAGDPESAFARVSGALVLRRDSGNVAISRRAPANTIVADGRHYTVLFQTRLPELTFVWRDVPAATSDLELHLESDKATRTLPGETPQRLASGTLSEGTYAWWYTTAAGQRSPRTTVTIRFDNAAPTAQFFRTVSAEDPQSSIVVDGVTLPGAKISVRGNSLAVDNHGRFRGAVVPEPGDSAVAVRLEHPRTGVHYYVRRHGSTRQP